MPKIVFSLKRWRLFCQQTQQHIHIITWSQLNRLSFSQKLTVCTKQNPGRGYSMLPSVNTHSRSDNVRCWGRERNIATCRHRGWGRHNCRHSDDVSVSCITVAENLYFVVIQQCRGLWSALFNLLQPEMAAWFQSGLRSSCCWLFARTVLQHAFYLL